MCSETKKLRSGTTIVELITTMVIALILVLVVGVLMVSGQQSWHRTYNSAHKKIKQDALTVMITFGSIGRRANRFGTRNEPGYIIYDKTGSVFSPAVPHPSNPDVLSGDAAEFRYWDVELDKGDPHGLMDVGTIATAYALFYLDGNQLKVDYGSYPPGGVPTGVGARNTSNIITTILAENVTTDPDIGAFSHTTVGSVGQGSVRINITLTDPNDGDSIKVMTATLMRNIWPR